MKKRHLASLIAAFLLAALYYAPCMEASQSLSLPADLSPAAEVTKSRCAGAELQNYLCGAGAHQAAPAPRFSPQAGAGSARWQGAEICEALPAGAEAAPGGSSGSATAGAGESGAGRGSPSQASGARKPVKLYGRIEELCTSPGARFPIKLQALTPRLDSRGTALRSRVETQTARVEAQTAPSRTIMSYPFDWAGVWSGALKVWTAQFAPTRWSFDATEASQEQQLLGPGKEGRATFEFAHSGGGRIQLAPTQVVFTAPMDQSRYRQTMQQVEQQMQAMGGFGGMPGMSEFLRSEEGNSIMSQVIKSVPYMYALHLGNLSQGTGVTGNRLNSRVVKNDLKMLASGVLEQQIVTYNEDQSRVSGKTHTNYSENVLRFSRVTSDQLYVQAASVDYDRNGNFESKVVLYGMITRGQGDAPAWPDFNSGGFPNMYPFGQ